MSKRRSFIFSGRIPFDRPIMDGFFVRHISLATSLWFVVVMQAIIVWENRKVRKV